MGEAYPSPENRSCMPRFPCILLLFGALTIYRGAAVAGHLFMNAPHWNAFVAGHLFMNAFQVAGHLLSVAGHPLTHVWSSFFKRRLAVLTKRWLVILSLKERPLVFDLNNGLHYVKIKIAHFKGKGELL